MSREEQDAAIRAFVQWVYEAHGEEIDDSLVDEYLDEVAS